MNRYGFTEADMDKEIFCGGENLISGFLSSGKRVTTLRDVLKRLRETYCGTIGVEYMHIQERDQCDWIRERFETPTKYSFPQEDRVRILDRLAWADLYERFLNTKYKTKRFGLDGCESLIPGLKAMIDTASDLGVNSVVIGMPHRGRLNVLANVVRKPLHIIFNEFNSGVVTPDLGDEYSPSGDVKYHLGTSYDRPTRNGKKIHLSLVANPSHLEAVDPVVEGKTRAKQHYANDTEHSQVCCKSLLICT
jgi:2-oxoglutarate dehydrogenase E1 component